MTDKIFWWNTEFGEEEKLAVSEVVLSNYLNEGPRTRDLEQAFGDFLKVPHVHAVPNGTVALALCLWALGVQPGDEVIIPDLTFIATASAVKMVGAVPVLVDVDAVDGNLKVADIESKISERTKAVIAVHINGRVVDVEGLNLLKKKYGLRLIGDCAQALGSLDSHEKSLVSYFDMSALSLAPSKIMSTGQGGLVMTNDQALSDKVIRLKDHGRMSRSEELHAEPGFNFKFTDLQAVVGLEQLKKLPSRLQKAKMDFAFYKDHLNGIEELEFWIDPADGFVPLWVDAICAQRDELRSALSKEGIEIRPFWGALHRQWLGGTDLDFPVASRLCDEGLWFPSGPSCPEETMARVCERVKAYFKK